MADAAGSVGVKVAGNRVLVSGNPVWDPVIALAIGAFVAVRAVSLGRQVLAVLGQHIPEGMQIETVTADLEAIEGVQDVHDLHVWTLTSGMNVATAHLVVQDDAASQQVLQRAQDVLRDTHRVEHATLQVEERPTSACHEVTW